MNIGILMTCVDSGLFSIGVFGGVMFNFSLLGCGVLGSSIGVNHSSVGSIRLSVHDMDLSLNTNNPRIHAAIFCTQTRSPAPMNVRFFVTSSALSLSRCSHHDVVCRLCANRRGSTHVA
jgi:hypothetical protein